jgi:2-iminobutanoate/2-iminopropanoate deaminase
MTYGPYSPIRRAGDLYFISGQVGINPQTSSASNNIETQTHQAITNLQSVLDSESLELCHIVKTTVFLKDIGDFESMNHVYSSYFDVLPPARSCVEVAKLPKLQGESGEELLIEIEAIAYREKS